MPAVDGTLIEVEGRPALRFERVLNAAPARVWRALTEPAEHETWHPSPFDLEPRVGGSVKYRGEDLDDGTVLEFQPESALAYTWGEDDLHWELEPQGSGTLLTLTHVFDDRLKAARDGAGWHVCLDRLDRAVDGDDAGDGPRAWDDLNREYQGKFGIDPSEATPVPAGHEPGKVS